jgi:hypothetical protein
MSYGADYASLKTISVGLRLILRLWMVRLCSGLLIFSDEFPGNEFRDRSTTA